MQDIINGRCGWCGSDELYVKYHDQEWGKLVTDDKTLFEFLVLESAQAGLSWITILKKREGYRKAFCNFDAESVAQMTDEDVERLMHFDGIVKNRLKIKSTITNARSFLAVQKASNILSHCIQLYCYLPLPADAIHQMIIHKSGGLQVSIANRSSKEFKSPFFHILAHGIRFGR